MPEWKENPLQPEKPEISAAGPVEINDSPDTDVSDSRAAEQTCFTDLACSTADVSAFCRAVVARVIPQAFWGDDSNKRIIMYWIDQFVSLRRFESLTLHQVMQKMQVK
jgi:telomerase reverse transcriptase